MYLFCCNHCSVSRARGVPRLRLPRYCRCKRPRDSFVVFVNRMEPKPKGSSDEPRRQRLAVSRALVSRLLCGTAWNDNRRSRKYPARARGCFANASSTGAWSIRPRRRTREAPSHLRASISACEKSLRLPRVLVLSSHLPLPRGRNIAPNQTAPGRQAGYSMDASSRVDLHLQLWVSAPTIVR